MKSGGDAGPDLTSAISRRLHKLWDAYKDGHERAHSSFLTAEYRAVHPDGTIHDGHPTAQDIAAAPITGYALTKVRAVPVASDAALVTYTADIEIPDGSRVQFEVGEVWVKQHGDWMCRYYQGTLRGTARRERGDNPKVES
jgi:hypothetical protein